MWYKSDTIRFVFYSDTSLRTNWAKTSWRHSFPESVAAMGGTTTQRRSNLNMHWGRVSWKMVWDHHQTQTASPRMTDYRYLLHMSHFIQTMMLLKWLSSLSLYQIPPFCMTNVFTTYQDILHANWKHISNVQNASVPLLFVLVMRHTTTHMVSWHLERTEEACLHQMMFFL